MIIRRSNRLVYKVWSLFAGLLLTMIMRRSNRLVYKVWNLFKYDATGLNACFSPLFENEAAAINATGAGK